ncbi:hypothetical protein [uncultured Helicobacter sp.]|uniref:type I restriction enzyme subunit R domain-containing protein n=1 Tax=uncultured Helicobacter sp. TaxID=175537 RepID=UPI0026ECDD83|nr:hypothetical protein [uncultured Helicobacter sp.]
MPPPPDKNHITNDGINDSLESTSPLRFTTALILHDTLDVGTYIESFKNGKIDIIFVYAMLLTGFDTPRLKKLYLCREAKEHNLLQTLTRVNRPYKNFHYGYVVDFADIDKEFDKTNKAYWDELSNELDDEKETYSKLFKTQEEIAQELQEINQTLWEYDTHNAEVFATQIQNLPKADIHELKSAINNAAALYNLITIQGYDTLKNKLDSTPLLNS